jgi:hypothetical protein
VFVIDRAGLASREDDARAELLLVVFELLPHRLGAADDGVDALLDVVPRIDLGEEILAVLHRRDRRLRRHVARRRQGDVLQQVVLEVAEVRLELLARLLVGVGDVDRHAPAHLLGGGGVAVPRAGVPKLIEDAAEHVDVEVRDAHVAEAHLGDEVDGLGAARAGDPDGRVRLLDRPGPGVDVAEEVVLAVPGERAGPGPRREDEVERLAELLAGGRRVEVVGEILRPAADHHARDEPAVRQYVEHGELFRDAQGRVVQGQGVAHDGDLAPLRALGQHGGDEVGRRHEAVSRLVVFVDANAVEAEFVGVGKGVDVFAVQVVALGGVVERVGNPDPGGVVFLGEGVVEERPGHEVEEVELHARLLREGSMSCSVASKPGKGRRQNRNPVNSENSGVTRPASLRSS